MIPFLLSVTPLIIFRNPHLPQGEGKGGPHSWEQGALGLLTSFGTPPGSSLGSHGGPRHVVSLRLSVLGAGHSAETSVKHLLLAWPVSLPSQSPIYGGTAHKLLHQKGGTAESEGHARESSWEEQSSLDSRGALLG